jgi:hypothetical protein
MSPRYLEVFSYTMLLVYFAINEQQPYALPCLSLTKGYTTGIHKRSGSNVPFQQQGLAAIQMWSARAGRVPLKGVFKGLNYLYAEEICLLGYNVCSLLKFNRHF